MKNILTTAFLCLFALTFAASAQDKQPTIQPTPTPKVEAKPTEAKLTAKDYEDLLDKLKKGDTSIDFKKFRLAFTETKEFAPYGGSDVRQKMNAALNKDDYKEALKLAEERLKTYYVDIDAHFTAFIANRELGKTKEAEFHRAVGIGLLDSILDGADGKTAKTAYFVISIREEYLVMASKGLRVNMQSLKMEDGHTFDVLSGTNADTKETGSFYFNIDKVFGRF
jgi:Domain of unknown function (DUF4919)